MFIKSCLTKEYPDDGPFAGGIVFKRCYGQGDGIGFTKEECKQMWSGIKLDDHIMFVEGETNDCGSASSSAAADGSGSASTTTGTTCVRPGDSIEIWCDDDELFNPCIVTQMRSNQNGTAWKCRYDDTTKPYWHDLESEQYRRIPPSIARLKKLRMKELRWRLRQDGVTFLSPAKKDVLVATLFDFMDTAESGTAIAASAAATTVPSIVDTNGVNEGGVQEVRAGDSIEVWWDEPEGFWGCVVAEQAPDVRSTTASYCVYDDGENRWHDLEVERYRIIAPSKARLRKLDATIIRQRLCLEDVPFAESVNKTGLEELLYQKLHTRFKPVAVPAYKPRSKFGFCHRDRMETRKRKTAERALCKTSESAAKVDLPTDKRTSSQVVRDIGIHGMAMYTLSTRGNSRDERQDERDGYNLLTFHKSVVGEGWTSGDDDMTKLPSRVASVYDTTGWVCVNHYTDGRVVMKRPPAPIPVRGSCAPRRRVYSNTRTHAHVFNLISYHMLAF